MTAWTPEEWADIGGADELRIAPLRRDGTLQRPDDLGGQWASASQEDERAVRPWAAGCGR